MTKSNEARNLMEKYISTIVVEGKFTDWSRLKEYCEQTITDSTGIALGIITKKISTDFGVYPVKFVLTYFDEGVKHRLRPVNRFTIENVLETGFDAILEKIGKKLLINLRLQRESPDKITN